MSKLLGTSVGVWNPNNQESFSNVSGKPFWIPKIGYRQAMSKLGTGNYNEFRNRQKIYDDLTKNAGLTAFQINNYFNKWKLRGNSSSDGFKQFVLNQILLKQAELKAEEKALAQIKQDAEDEIIRDVVDMAPEPINNNNAVNSNANLKSSNNNLLLYGGLGLAVVIVGYIIYKKVK
mgnify:CR=1 FL=1|tara:strand:+ start:2723 stop:3250 length:528 start_codon:yes stop_codon:yes gene_type:complete